MARENDFTWIPTSSGCVRLWVQAGNAASDRRGDSPNIPPSCQFQSARFDRAEYTNSKMYVPSPTGNDECRLDSLADAQAALKCFDRVLDGAITADKLDKVL